MKFNDVAPNYNSILDRALRFSGYGWEYFARYKADLIARVVGGDYAGTILDYGCGVGNLVGAVKELLPRAQIDGFDVSTESLKRLATTHKDQGLFTSDPAALQSAYGVIVVANVFHHIQPTERRVTLDMLTAKLAPGGRLMVFEHNPFNPMTRLSVHLSPIDEDAILVRSSQMQELMANAGLHDLERRYIVFFPKIFSWLTPFEPSLTRVPLGAQYLLLGRKRAAT